MKIITHEILRSWQPCSDGYRCFCELFPDGADLKTASEGLIADGHNSWSDWLWSKCKASEDFCEQTVRTAGDYGTATAGNGGTATAGHYGTATAGYEGTATAGYRGTATAGYRGTATAGYRGTATAGHYGTATAGYEGTATAGYRGTATAGNGGAISILFWDSKKREYLRKIGAIDGDNLKPGVAYRLDENGFFIEVKHEYY